MLNKPAVAPMDTIIKLSHADLEFLADNKLYISLIGKLLYLTITKPDIATQFNNYLSSWISLLFYTGKYCKGFSGALKVHQVIGYSILPKVLCNYQLLVILIRLNLVKQVS